jgi:hypothetical protein
MSRQNRVLRKAVALASRPDDNLVELARRLADLYDEDPLLVRRFVEQSRMGLRKAYCLAELGRHLAGLELPEERLKAVGWTKAHVIAKHLKPDNVERLLSLAEGHSVKKLMTLVRGARSQQKLRCVLLYFTPSQYRWFERALLRHGAMRSGRGLANKEAAVLKIFETAGHGPAPSGEI